MVSGRELHQILKEDLVKMGQIKNLEVNGAFDCMYCLDMYSQTSDGFLFKSLRQHKPIASSEFGLQAYSKYVRQQPGTVRRSNMIYANTCFNIDINFWNQGMVVILDDTFCC